MLKRISLILVALLLCGCSGPTLVTPPPTSPREMGTIVAFGDSLTAGLGLEESEAYPAQLERRLQKDGFAWKVVNAGLSGETSSAARARVSWVMRLHPRLVILETGANDGLRGIEPKITEDNLREIMSLFKKSGVTVLLVGMRAPENLGEDYVHRFADLYPRLARTQGVAFTPFFLEGVAAVPELNQPDRIHPTQQGYAVVVDNIAPQVEELLKAARPAQ